jgi:hypothetical protein
MPTSDIDARVSSVANDLSTVARLRFRLLRRIITAPAFSAACASGMGQGLMLLRIIELLKLGPQALRRIPVQLPRNPSIG